MENQPIDGDTARRENAISRHPMTLPIGSLNAQDAGAAIDLLVSDSSFGELRNSPSWEDSTLSTYGDTTTSAPLAHDPENSSHLIAFDTVEEIDIGGEGQWEELLEELSNEKPTNATAAWKGKRQERDYLQAQVVELEQQLQQLKPPCMNSNVMVESSVWMQIASRQSEAKRKALAENTKLRKLLEGQLKVARSLEKLLYKRALCDADNHGLRKRTRFATIPERDVDPVRDEIRGRIQDLLDSVDTIMEESGLSLFYTAMEDARAVATPTTNNAICMEMVVVRVLPFPLEQVAKVHWELTTADHIKFETGWFGASRRSESMCDVQYTAQAQLRRAEAVLHVEGVCARRTYPGRTLIVLEAVGTTRGSLFAHDPVHSREQTFFLIEKNLETTENDEPSTVMRVCVRLWPENVEDNKEHTTANVLVRSFIDLVIGCYNENVMTVMQLVENTLLEQSLDKKSTFR